MAAQRKYPEELGEHAVKMVLEVRERKGKGDGEVSRVAPAARSPALAADDAEANIGVSDERVMREHRHLPDHDS